MSTRFHGTRVLPLAVFLACVLPCPSLHAEDPGLKDARMGWWREARFGLFIHWGLYAIPAGEWKGQTNHAEWIRHTAQIPIEEYDKFVGQFNPVKFDARDWVRMAKDAGMQYIVITSKHHDGFALFDSQVSDFDVMATPFRRDILKELSQACRENGIRLCFYHSIMDWHHPDYLPRRPWEAAQRPAGDASYDRYVAYMKSQLRELLTNYGPIGILWFDGEWEDTWTHERGVDLYDYVRGLQSDIIINNRVDTGRSGMAGMTQRGHVGDYGTPEQEIPATGIPGEDWESCMTMNANWGYNKADANWKSSEQLVRMLIDIASKGGNFLLNVGPMASGEFPPESVERLAAIGRWMKTNGQAIYGTSASPFRALPWGRCTQKRLAGGDTTRLYLHVFEWPADGILHVPGIFNDARQAWLMADSEQHPMQVERRDDALRVKLPPAAPDAFASVVVLDVAGAPDIAEPPTIAAATEIFIDTLAVQITSGRENVELHYTTDGRDPQPGSPKVAGPVQIEESCLVRARAFREGRAVSPIASAEFRKVRPWDAWAFPETKPGLTYQYYEGEWDALPDFDALQPVKTGIVPGLEFSPGQRSDNFAFRYSGAITVPADGVYQFHLASDDGSKLWIDDQLVVDNDRLHSVVERSGAAPLKAGPHRIRVEYFERGGSNVLELAWTGPDGERKAVPASALSHSDRVP